MLPLLTLVAIPQTLSQHSYVCNCKSIYNGIEKRVQGRAAFVELMDELMHIARTAYRMDPTQLDCPGVHAFAKMVGEVTQQTAPALAKMVRAQLSSAACDDHKQPMHECIGQHAWSIVRTSTIFSDMYKLEKCGACFTAARRQLQVCYKLQGATRQPLFAHVAAVHGAASSRPWASVSGGMSPRGVFLYMGLDAAACDPRDVCCVRMDALAPSLTRYHTSVLAEGAAAIAIGISASCLGLPKWLSLGSARQVAKGNVLPCANLTRAPLETLDMLASVRLRCANLTSALLETLDMLASTSSSMSKAAWSSAWPLAVVYTHLEPRVQANPMSPFADGVRPVVHAMYLDETGTRLPANLPTLAKVFGWVRATHPCCQSLIMSAAAWRGLASAHLLVLARTLLHRGSEESFVGRFRYDRPGWANFSHGCFSFEGLAERNPTLEARRGYKDARWHAAFSYVLETAAVAYVYATQGIVQGVQNVGQQDVRTNPGRTTMTKAAASVAAAAAPMVGSTSTSLQGGAQTRVQSFAPHQSAPSEGPLSRGYLLPGRSDDSFCNAPSSSMPPPRRHPVFVGPPLIASLVRTYRRYVSLYSLGHVACERAERN